MDYNDRFAGSFFASLPTLRTSGRGRGGHTDHARGGGRRASIVVSHPAKKLTRPSDISLMGHEWPGLQCCLRRQSIRRATLTRGPVAVLYRGIPPFCQIWGDNPASLAGRISSDRALCRAHHLSASAGLVGIEAGRIKQRNDWRGEQVSETRPAEATSSFPIIRLLTMLPNGKL